MKNLNGYNVKFKILVLLFFIFEVLVSSCVSNQNNSADNHQNYKITESLVNLGKKYFKQNKFLEALGPFSEANYYNKKDLEIRCYIGLCICYIEESERGKQKIDDYLKYSKEMDPYLLNKIGRIYGHEFKEYQKAIIILDKSIIVSNSTNFMDYIEKGYMYLYLNRKDDAINMFITANKIALQQNDATGMELAPQLLEQIDELLKIFQKKNLTTGST